MESNRPSAEWPRPTGFEDARGFGWSPSTHRRLLAPAAAVGKCEALDARDSAAVLGMPGGPAGDGWTGDRGRGASYGA